MEYKLAVIGGGSGGIAAARTAAMAGAQVALISNGPIGGRAGWDSLLPSKVWLAAADRLGDLEPYAPNARLSDLHQPTSILGRIEAIGSTWNEAQRDQLVQLGVHILQGSAAFINQNRLSIELHSGAVEKLSADRVIIASGSGPVFPAGLKPDGKRVLAPRFARKLDQLPKTVIVIGAGATSTEFVYLFNRFGVRVTWIVDPFGILPGFDAEAGRQIGSILEQRGVKIVSGAAASQIDRYESKVVVRTDLHETFEAELAFVGIGRAPDLNRLALEHAGLHPSKNGALVVDGYGQTTNPAIYAVGDAAGTPMVANKAAVQGRIAAAHALGIELPPYRPETTVLAVYTQPQIAQVGTLNSAAQQMTRWHIPTQRGLKAFLSHEAHGHLWLALEPSSRKILGALAVSDHAADMLAVVAVAIQMGATLADLAAVAPAHPTAGELVFLAAQQSLEGLTPVNILETRKQS